MNALPNVIHLDMPQNFTPPLIEEVILHGAKIGLPEMECEKFWFFYDSKDWKVGKTKMARWRSALAGWKLRCRERVEEKLKPIAVSPSVLAIKNQTALTRIEARIQVLRGLFPLRDEKQKVEWNNLKQERERLKKELGFIA